MSVYNNYYLNFDTSELPTMLYLSTTVLYFPYSTLALVWKIQYTVFALILPMQKTITSYTAYICLALHPYAINQHLILCN